MIDWRLVGFAAVQAVTFGILGFIAGYITAKKKVNP